ncbi:signal peptidase I [Lyticum sinuosum]|uniref:Signal peptidase I n=1 Tax=Lyticum sinuosum TaxID=1332059 RepID=A0AAE4VM30_9RICK|nr:signal peptidase I [Lyticum sinuosum]MDZ5761233.1 Signal peptidase I [Lyticum sinuosum]
MNRGIFLSLKEFAIISVIALLLHILIRLFVIEIFFVPTGSMIPSILINDHLIVTKYSYGYGRYNFVKRLDIDERFLAFNNPERGDVVIFHSEFDNDKTYIKRVIGLPGDKIKLIRGEIIINGQKLKRVINGTYEMNISNKNNKNNKNFLNINTICHRYIEELPNGVKYNVLYHEDADLNSFPNTTKEYIIPDNHYFMMGDNRNYSVDSRFDSHMGMIPSANIQGKARIILYNKSILSSLQEMNGLRSLRIKE